MSSKIAFGAIPRLGGSVTSSANDLCSTIQDVASPAQEARSDPGPTNAPVDDDPTMPNACHFAPFDEHLNELAKTPRWHKDLDNHITTIFRRSVLSGRAIDDMVAPVLQIIGRPTRAKIRGLAQTIYIQWTCMQFRSKNTNESAREIVSLISRISDRLGLMSFHTQKNFLDELSCLCIERLKLTLHWYVDTVFHGVLPIPRENLFMRVMGVVRMIGHLFHGGQFQYSAALNALRYIATMSPWPDAIAIVYALLHELGPKFGLEHAGWRFIQCLLAELLPLTVRRVHTDPLSQLVFAINALLAEWCNGTRVTLYHTHLHKWEPPISYASFTDVK